MSFVEKIRNPRANTKPATIVITSGDPLTPSMTTSAGATTIICTITPQANSLPNINGFDLSYTDTITGITRNISINRSATSVMLTGFVTNRWYELQIRSLGFNEAKVSAYSQVIREIPVTLNPVTPNGSPLASSGQVVFNWNAPASIPSGFFIKEYEISCAYNAKHSSVASADTTTRSNILLSSTTRTYTYTGLTNNVQYAFNIIAVYGLTGYPSYNARVPITTSILWSPMELPGAITGITFNSYTSTGYNRCNYTLAAFKSGYDSCKVNLTFTAGTRTNAIITRNHTAAGMYITDIGSSAFTSLTSGSVLTGENALLNNQVYNWGITANNGFNDSIATTGTFTTGREPIPTYTGSDYDMLQFNSTYYVNFNKGPSVGIYTNTLNQTGFNLNINGYTGFCYMMSESYWSFNFNFVKHPRYPYIVTIGTKPPAQSVLSGLRIRIYYNAGGTNYVFTITTTDNTADYAPM